MTVDVRSPPSAAARSDRDTSARLVWVVLILATIVALVVRLPFLGHQSLWLDEVYTRDIIGEPTLGGLWSHLRATESTPPLSYALLWLLGGRSAAAMRAMPAAALIAAVPVSYFAFRRLIGSRAALAVAAILSVSPVFVSYSLDARSYALLVLTALLSLWAFSSVIERPRSVAFACWAASSAACIWTHYFGAFVIAGEAVALLLAVPTERWKVIAWSLVIAACSAPLLPLALHQSGDQRAEFIAGVPLRTRFTSALREFAMGPNVPRSWLEAAGILLFWASAAAGALYALRKRDRGALILALALIAAGTPLLLAVLGIDDLFYARNVIATAPLIVALAAPSMLRFRAAPLAAYLLLAAVTSVWVATDWRYEQLDWRAAIRRAEAVHPAAPVVALTTRDEPVLRTYLGRQPVSPAGLQTDRVWLIVPPLRTAGHRFLGPAPAPALPGFTTLRAMSVHGFTLLFLGAARTTTVGAGDIAGSVVFPGS